jgi:hypothetical protein
MNKALTAEPANTGTASSPVPRMPMANTAPAKSPAIGRSAGVGGREPSSASPQHTCTTNTTAA